MRFICVLLLSSFIFYGCKKHDIVIKSKPVEIKFKSRLFLGADPKLCKGDYNCGNIKIQTLVIDNKSIIADIINSEILKSIDRCIPSFYEDKPSVPAKNYDEIKNSFIQDYNKYKTEMNEYPVDSLPNWNAEVTTKIGYQSNHLLNIIIYSNYYTGGAHPYSAYISLIFDPKSGKIIPKEKLFKDLKAITAFAEIKFKENQKLSKEASLEKEGYFFEKGIFVLPENILFSQKGIILHYNQYEAASYAQGPIDFEISFSEVKKYLRIK